MPAIQPPTMTAPQPLGLDAGQGLEFLAFRVGEQEYGVDILRVQEIRSYDPPTRMSSTPTHILGVMDLRGVIVPIVDLRIKFGADRPAYDEFTVVIVLDMGEQLFGMVVDGVSDVIRLTRDQMHAAPEFASTSGYGHIRAIASLKQRMLSLLDIDKLMRGSDMLLPAGITH